MCTLCVVSKIGGVGGHCWHMALLLLGGELLAERCRTDDLVPSISFLCLPPCSVDPEIL